MNVSTKTVLISAAGLAASLAFAGQAPDPSKETSTDVPKFEELDSNADGMITPTEARGTWLATNFTKADSNQDGNVTRAEYDKVAS